MKSLITLLSAVVLWIVPVTAQDEPVLVCDDAGAESIAVLLEAASTALREAEAVEDALLLAQTSIATYRAACAELTFTSDEYGLNSVTDPIAFPDGVYRMRLEAPGLASVELTALDGECGEMFVYVLSDGGETEAVSIMEGCLALLDFEGPSDWTLVYEPVVIGGD